MDENNSLHRRPRQENIELKNPYETNEKVGVQDVDSPAYTAGADEDVWGDTEYDIRDMQRLGKKQEFKVIASPTKEGAIG
jgi:hypothetical protein